MLIMCCHQLDVYAALQQPVLDTYLCREPWLPQPAPVVPEEPPQQHRERHAYQHQQHSTHSGKCCMPSCKTLQRSSTARSELVLSWHSAELTHLQWANACIWFNA